MSTNTTVTASVGFDYQAQHYELSNVIDIENIIYHDDFFNAVYLSIARANNIDLYSYQLDVILDQTIIFSNAKGCVEGCLNNGKLDLILLRENYQQTEYLSKIKVIAEQFKIHDNITTALLEAYLLGKKSS
ncbi:hypothetical protein [Candidatus Vesicomyidisocius sp. SY067_SCS001]|uniref:hypothetical protein n=1 Tax=Candidatus Vesicomyidisocius sp. SY067_SCS001 TaxID=2732590 RepID=UPI0016876C89|nr:hypothetical protein [Candidatus Vesicomyosocius sp. SY067_SCS001]